MAQDADEFLEISPGIDQGPQIGEAGGFTADDHVVNHKFEVQWAGE